MEVGGEGDLAGSITARTSQPTPQRPTTPPSTTTTETNKTSLGLSHRRNRNVIRTEQGKVTSLGAMKIRAMKMKEDMRNTDMMKEEDMKTKDMRIMGMMEGGHIQTAQQTWHTDPCLLSTKLSSL